MKNIITKLLPIAFIILLGTCCVNFARAGDAEVLLELAAAARITLPGWSASNVNNLCVNWANVTCDSNNRVSRLILNSARNVVPKPEPTMRGTIPAVIANLTELIQLNIVNNDLYGEVPIELFSLPKLESLTMSTNALFLKFPPVITSPLTDLAVDDNFLNGSLPSMNWANLTTIDFSNIAAKCPLPQSLVDYLMSGGYFHTCRLRGNRWWIDSNNFLCGQIHIENVTCELFPLPHLPPYFASDTRSDVQFRAEIYNHTIEFNDSQVFIFSAYTSKSGVRKEYRREYISFKLQPSSEAFTPLFGVELLHPLVVGGWDTFALEGTSRVRANTTRMNDMLTEYIFEWILVPDEPAKIKFSFIVYNFGHVWKYIQTPRSTLSTSVFFTFGFRMAHSPSVSGGRGFSCVYQSPFSTLCDSSILRFSTGANIFAVNNEFWVTAQTNTSSMKLVYGVVGMLDDVPFSSDSGNVFVNRMPLPLPTNYWFESRNSSGVPYDFGPIADEDQVLSFPVEFSMLPFQKRMLYDPDITLTLLFDPAENDPDPAAQAGMTAGVIVAIVIAVAVGIAGVVLFAKYLFPYLASRSAVTSGSSMMLESDEIQTEPSAEARNSWKSVRPTQ